MEGGVTTKEAHKVAITVHAILFSLLKKLDWVALLRTYLILGNTAPLQGLFLKYSIEFSRSGTELT